MPGIFQQLVDQPELSYAGLSRVLVSATSFMKKEAESAEPALGMRATVACRHCGKAGYSANEYWTAHPEKKPTSRKKIRCFGCNGVGHLRKDTINQNV